MTTNRISQIIESLNGLGTKQKVHSGKLDVCKF